MSQVNRESFKLSALGYLADIISIATGYTGREITDFFYRAGFPEICHDGSTKQSFVYQALQQLQNDENGSSHKIIRVIEQLADPQEYINNQEKHEMIVQSLNDMLSYYGYKVNNRGKVVPTNTARASIVTEFYISYDRADQDWAEWIAWQLEDVGHSTTLDAWDFRPGDNFVLKMQEASEKSERTIMVLSPAYLDSIYKQSEWAAAFARDPTGQQGLLLPIQVHQCKNRLRGLLAQIILVDLVGLDEADARQELFNGIYHRRSKPARVPNFPGGADEAK